MNRLSEYKPKAVEDIKASLLYENKDESIYCVGSISRDKYVKMPQEIVDYVMKFIQYLDGRNTLEQIENKFRTEEKVDLDVEYLLGELEKADLISNNMNQEKVEKGEFDRFFFKIIDIPLDKYSERIRKINKKIVKCFFFLSLVLISLGILSAIFNVDYFFSLENYKINKSLGASAAISIPIFLISILLHESAHAVAASYYGLTPSNMVFGFYANFSSMFYLKIPGIYTLTKKQKIVVWSSGVFTNLLISATALLVGQCVGGGGAIIANLCIMANLSLVLCNLSPLLPLDGYFLLSTIINQPNLRKNSFGMFNDIIHYKGSLKLKLIYIVYFMCSVGFMAFITIAEIKYLCLWIISQYELQGSMVAVIRNSKVILLLSAIIVFKAIFYLIKKVMNK